MLTRAQQYIEDRIERIPESGCWIWMKSCIGWGYGQAMVERRHRYAHHLAWEAYRGPRVDGLQVLHECDIPACCNPAHLYLGTPKNNTHDRIRRGKRLDGENHGCAKLTEEQVKEILQTTKYVDLAKDLARRYGVGRTTIDMIRAGHNWKYLK